MRRALVNTVQAGGGMVSTLPLGFLESRCITPGRYIVIAPEQADIVGCRMSDIANWVDEAPDE